MDIEAAEQVKRGQRANWAAGDFHKLAAKIWDVGGLIVDQVAPRQGERLLDVACGTGNVTIRAAQTGADVVGLDLTPELLEVARLVAADAGVEVEWVEGDAEALPFEDASFDVVTSSFGCMFAPRHRVAAAELGRVLRDGGRIAVAAWRPEGEVGRFFRVIPAHLPPPPEGFEPPPLWGDEGHVREIFDGTGVELTFQHASASIDFESPDAALLDYETEFGPLVIAKRALEPEGKWEALRDDLRTYFESANTAGDGSFLWEPEYLLIGGTKRA